MRRNTPVTQNEYLLNDCSTLMSTTDTKSHITYYKGFPEQSTPVFNFCLFINERQGIRLRYYKRSC